MEKVVKNENPPTQGIYTLVTYCSCCNKELQRSFPITKKVLRGSYDKAVLDAPKMFECDCATSKALQKRYTLNFCLTFEIEKKIKSKGKDKVLKLQVNQVFTDLTERQSKFYEELSKNTGNVEISPKDMLKLRGN